MNDMITDLPIVIAMQGASNVRDMGGWATTDGRTVARGRLFRSAALHGLTDADLAAFAALGLRTVCDFRGEAEQAKAPSRLPDGVVLHLLCIQPTIGASLADLAKNSEANGDDVIAVLCQAYAAYALDWADQYRAMFELILAGDLPLLFHCTAGKDRTGFAATLILSALGVDRETIRQDYLATNRIWQPPADLASHLPPSAAKMLLSAHPAFLDAAFAAIDAAYPTMDAYLEAKVGLDAGKREKLRELLLD